MKKKHIFTKPYSNTKYETSVFILNCLSGSTYGREELDEHAVAIEHIHQAFSRLITMLYDDGKLSRADVHWIADGYIPKDLEDEEEM